MATKIFKLEFQRPFSVFSYQCSHGLLLLRSGKSNAHRTRIDILFQDVVALECRMSFSGLTVEEVGPEFLETTGTKSAETIQSVHRVYALRSEDWSGFVVGGNVYHHEDEAHFFVRSALLGPEL